MPPEVINQNPGFLNLPAKVSTSDGWHFSLLETLRYFSKAGELIEITPGSESDGGSEPREMWMEYPPFGDEWPAYYLHDFLYRYTHRPKSQCDLLLFEAMGTLGVSEIRRRVIYAGVHLFGQASFDADRAALAKEEALAAQTKAA